MIINKKIVFISLIIISIITLILIILILKQSKYTYYKCPQKDNSVLIKKIFDKFKINRKNIIYNLYIPCGYNRVETELSEAKIGLKTKFIFGIKGCDKIVSKNNLWLLLEEKYGRNIAKEIMPESFILYNEQYDLLINKYNINKINIICKKNLQRKEGLKIVTNLNELKIAKKENYKVAQVFITNSLLVNNRKINLRIYLIISIHKNSIDFYLSNIGKCLYTKKEHNGNIHDKESNITSYKVNPNIYNNNPHNFKELNIYLNKKRINWDILWEKIIKLFLKFSEASYTQFKQPNKFYNKKCFQLFGADIILDNSFHPYLLEINKGPDMIPKCKKDETLKERIYHDTFSLVGFLPKKKNNSFFKIYSNNI